MTQKKKMGLPKIAGNPSLLELHAAPGKVGT